uniref:Endophilin-A3 n=1 Tax=Hydra vulgaris TaxID=6087 RepID=T2M6T7_HYDVU
MSLAGLKKQFNKTSQFLSERVAGTKGSQLEEEFKELERKIDIVTKAVDDLHNKSREYLQPNPSARTKLAVQASYQKARGQTKSAKYPQVEQNLADVFLKAGADLNDELPYSQSLMACGNTFTQIAEIKDSLEFSVKQNFLDPLYQLQQKDLKEINHHRKKLESRRLDFDYKKSKGAKGVPEEELNIAEEKFTESKELCYNSMMNFIDSDVEHIGQIHAFAEAVRDYHHQCADLMDALVKKLAENLSEAASRPKEDRVFISRPKFDDSGSLNAYDIVEKSSPLTTPTPPQRSAPAAPNQKSKMPCCRAMYDFEPENEGELGFQEGDVIELTSRIDENWLEGRLKGQIGFFPQNYVEIIVPL